MSPVVGARGAAPAAGRYGPPLGGAALVVVLSWLSAVRVPGVAGCWRPTS